jgi:hypothetical protein
MPYVTTKVHTTQPELFSSHRNGSYLSILQILYGFVLAENLRTLIKSLNNAGTCMFLQGIHWHFYLLLSLLCYLLTKSLPVHLMVCFLLRGCLLISMLEAGLSSQRLDLAAMYGLGG